MNRILIALVVCVFSFGVFGQTQKEAPAKPAEKESSAQATQTVERDVSEEEEGDLDEDIFIPTEKINVDSSVSFPVDI